MSLRTNLAPDQATVWLEQWYLELARSALPVIDSDNIWANLSMADENTLANIEYAWKTVVVINSSLAVEAFCNNKLYRIWQRGENCEEGKRFITIFGKIANFEKLRDDRKNSKRIRELTERIKTLFEIMGFQPLSESKPQLWGNFIKLVKDSRHFLVHPLPEEGKLDRCLNVLRGQDSKLYSDTARDIISYYYERRPQPPPPWLIRNTLFEISSVRYLGGTVKLQHLM